MLTHFQRKGSIPAVVGMVAVLATLGAAAVFMTNGMNRLDRRADLSRKAGWIASTAAEETILDLMNGTADWMTPRAGEKNIKLTYPAPATAMMYGKTGALVDPVKVMGRRLDEPKVEAQWRNMVYGALSAGPRFSANHDPAWEQKLPSVDPKLSKLLAPPAGVVPDAGTRDLYAGARGAQGGDKIGEAWAEFDRTAGPGNPSAIRDALEKTGDKLIEAAVAASCGNVAPDVGVLTTIGGIALGKDVVQDKSQGSINTLDDLQAQPDEVDADADGKAPGDATAGAAASAQAASGAANAKAGAKPQKPFNVADFRQLAERGGVLRKDRYLITLEAAASIEGANMDIEVPHVTHRVFARLHYGETLLFAYGRLLAYVGYHYRLPFEQMVKMGMITPAGMVTPERVMPTVEASYSAHPGPQAWPFPVATSIMRVAE